MNAEIAQDMSELMQVVGGPVAVPAVARFAAAEHFLVGGSDLPISLLGEDFLAHFLPLVEADVAASTLYQRVLVKSTIDAPIFVALGGEDAASVPLAHLFAFLKTADRDKWYFFYVRDVAGQLWAVDTYWRDNGWDMEAYSVTYPRGWRGGGHVVSR